MLIAHAVVRNQRSRNRDAFGSGQFGASRSAGSRTHQGLDIIADPQEAIFSPIKGTIIREALPYKNDASIRGIVMNGREEWQGYRIKIFYVQGLLSGDVFPGQLIAYAQDLRKKYPGITNHIHIEVLRNGRAIVPHEIFAQCF